MLVEKGQEYQLEKDNVRQPEVNKMLPDEEVKDIRPAAVDDDDVVINKKGGAGNKTPNIDNEKTANTFYGSSLKR